ncbi:MAG: hypothetical protein ABR964_15690 [Tepidisphaeraceae bacterium]|jgi:hypothetical protein
MGSKNELPAVSANPSCDVHRFDAAIYLFLFLCICVAICLDVVGRYFRYQVQERENLYAQVDAMFRKGAWHGALYVHYVNFPQNKNWMARDLFTRGVYTLYPHSVLAGDPSVPTFSPDQFMAANFEPDPPWLFQHDIGSELTFTLQPDGLVDTYRRFVFSSTEDH